MAIVERPVAGPDNSKFVMVPHVPKVAPVNEKPNIVVAPVDTMKPAASASPPEALIIVAPSTLN